MLDFGQSGIDFMVKIMMLTCLLWKPLWNLIHCSTRDGSRPTYYGVLILEVQIALIPILILFRVGGGGRNFITTHIVTLRWSDTYTTNCRCRQYAPRGYIFCDMIWFSLRWSVLSCILGLAASPDTWSMRRQTPRPFQKGLRLSDSQPT